MSTIIRMCACLVLLFACAAHAQDSFEFNLPAQALADSLRAVGSRASVNVVFEPSAVGDRKAPELSGTYSVREALERLVEGAGLTVKVTEGGSFVIEGMGNKTTVGNFSAGSEDIRLTQADDAVGAGTQEVHAEHQNILEEVQIAIPEILVTGQKSLNTDIRRTRDDAQPYVVLGRDTIERSGAANVEDFLKTRLPMNTQGFLPGSQGQSSIGNVSQINLRGLGTNQTLILIDGHRTVSTVFGGEPAQPDLNGIPLAAVERIEILPTTASGIYGGSATGGVINVVLRRDYSGAQAAVKYGNAFDSDARNYEANVSAGFNFDGGKTQLLLALNYGDQDGPAVGDRSLFRSGRDRVLANNPSGVLLFGALPPLGRTTNIMSLDGSPLFGAGTASFTTVPVGYAGGGGLAPLAANAGQFNLDLANTRQSEGGGAWSLLPDMTDYSVMTTVRREFAPSVHAFLEASASRKRTEFLASNVFSAGYVVSAAAANNPFGQDIMVTVPVDAGDGATITHVNNDRLVGGLIVRLPGGWSSEVDYTWGRFRDRFTGPPSSLSGAEFDSIFNGTFDVLRDTDAFALDFTPYLVPADQNSPHVSKLQDATLRFTGPVGTLPAGSPTLSALVEHRRDSFDESSVTNSFGTRVFPSRSQSIDSAYLETQIPLLSQKNGMRFARALELQLAARYDEYSVNGVTSSVLVGSGATVARGTSKTSSVDPTVALRFKPVSSVMLRGSYGTGFLPPTVNQIVPNISTINIRVRDPRRGNAITTIAAGQMRTAGNPNLQPEDSEAWSAGAVLTPQDLPGLRLSVDYTHIAKSSNIVNLTVSQTLANELDLPGRITRGSAAGDPFGIGPIVAIDATAINISRAEVATYDAALDYQFKQTRVGTFGLSAIATWQQHYKTQFLATSAVVENVGVASSLASNPLKFKSNAEIIWKYHGWSAAWTARYFHSYIASTDPFALQNQGNGGRVPSQLYHDLFASYRFGSNNDTEAQLGVQNLFNKKPPFDAGISGLLYSAFGDPRLASYYVGLKKEF